MHKQLISCTCLLVAALGLASCDGSVPNGPVRPNVIVPSVNSSFVYDYEQRIIPVKPEDDDTTYKFELTAKVDQHLLPEEGRSEMIGVSLYDAEGFPMPNLRYKLSVDQAGNIYYNEPYYSNTWTKMAFMTRESISGPDTIIGDHSDYYQEVRQKTTYLGTEFIAVGDELVECEKIEWTRSFKETDPYTTAMGTQEERHIFWFAKYLGFFAARESDLTSNRLHKPKWKYHSKEQLKRYTLAF